MAMVGSRGDVQPFVALGHALRAAGHEVAVTANADAADLVAAAGARFVPFDLDVHTMLSSQEGQRLLANGRLGSGDPPVFIGFGSMPILDPAPLVDAAIEAARLAGVRVLVGAGWTELAKADATLPEYVRLTGDIDHDWLFPRCRAVIHHGGTGTTGAGLTAGRPTWIYSLFFDQPFWGTRVPR
jgi:UDP:flavonoid glycosyltransferase YjiC (YdhE family)